MAALDNNPVPFPPVRALKVHKRCGFVIPFTFTSLPRSLCPAGRQVDGAS